MIIQIVDAKKMKMERNPTRAFRRNRNVLSTYLQNCNKHTTLSIKLPVYQLLISVYCPLCHTLTQTYMQRKYYWQILLRNEKCAQRVGLNRDSISFWGRRKREKWLKPTHKTILPSCRTLKYQ